MGLSDVVSGSGTVAFAQVGFVISFVVFTIVVLWALVRPRSALMADARIALSDGITNDSSQDAKEWSNGK